MCLLDIRRELSEFPSGNTTIKFVSKENLKIFRLFLRVFLPKRRCLEPQSSFLQIYLFVVIMVSEKETQSLRSYMGF